MMETTSNKQSSDVISIPREITIEITASTHGQCSSNNSSLMQSSVSMAMQWEPHDNSMPRYPTGFNGGVVSLQSSDCSSHESVLASIDPLDYRQDWSKDIRNDLTHCIHQNPHLFQINDGHNIPSDNNSLYSCLSEEYEMECDQNLTGIWDEEMKDGF